MKKEGGNFFEEHIEKVILLIVGAVCVWLIITRVILSPNYVEYDGQKFSTGEIDKHILNSEPTKKLEEILTQLPEPKTYKPNKPEFVAKLRSAISNIEVNLDWPVPDRILKDVIDKRKYSIPKIGDVWDVGAEHIRTVVFAPTEEVDKNHRYEEVGHELKDLDFVTVEAKFDVSQLAEEFYRCFAGEGVEKKEWQDPSLAKPIFGAVELQRQELLPDGRWSTNWQTVARTQIDPYKDLFRLIENVEDLPVGGMKAHILVLNKPQVMIDLLQPEPYRIASEDEKWFPPFLHKEYVKHLEEVQRIEKRKAAIEAEEKKKRERAESLKRRRQEREQREQERRSTWDTGRRETTRPESEPARRTRTVEPEEERPEIPEVTTSIDDFYDELGKMYINPDVPLAQISEPLVFWAYDDTVEPENTYRYRIRLGILDPIAGTDKIYEKDSHFKNQVILWSGFSDTTEPVKIPRTLCFFATEAKSSDVVNVKVSRYVLGYWYSDEFNVERGETIGRVVQVEDKKERPGVTTDEAEEEIEEVKLVDTIDYRTGALLVDILQVKDWSGGKHLYSRLYYDMLYTYDGTSIRHMPVKLDCWPTELRTKFREIRDLEKKPRMPFLTWEESQSGIPRRYKSERTYRPQKERHEETTEPSIKDIF